MGAEGEKLPVKCPHDRRSCERRLRSRTNKYVCIYVYVVGAFLRGGYVTVPRCRPRKVSPLLHLIESLFSLSFSLCLSWFISLPPSFYTKPSSLPAGHRIPICSPRPSPDVSLILSLKSLLPPTFTACPGPSSPSYHAYVAGLLRGFKRPDTLVHRWYHHS